MGTKFLILLLISLPVLAQEEIQVGAEKVFALENQVMVYQNSGEQFRMRTDQRNFRSLSPSDQVSEIFADSPDGGGKIRSLPGGIIVELESGEDPKKWAVDNQQTLIREIGENTYLIKSSIGRKTLSEVTIVESLPQVQSARPNWWSAVESKGRVPASRGKIRSHAQMLGR